MQRCAWVNTNPLMIEYHDREWGIPSHEDRRLFEFLILEGAQAGLSWETILKKRENYRKALDQFDPTKIARYGPKDVKRLLNDPGIVRNRLKIEATITNARQFLNVQEEWGSFDKYMWQFVGGTAIRNQFTSLSQVPAKTQESDTISKDLLRRGFKFVGSTICYAFMQAVGLVNDHTVDCFRYGQVSAPLKVRRDKSSKSG